MKIAMVSEHAGPFTVGWEGHDGGQRVHVAGLARALGRMGHHVTIYTRRQDPDAGDCVRLGPRVAVVHVAAGPQRPLLADDRLGETPGFAAQLARRWAAERPEVIHAHNWTSGVAALAVSQDLDLPVVATFHTIARTAQRHGEAIGMQRTRLETAIGRTAAAVIATSDSAHAELLRIGVPRHRLTVIPAGVDIKRFTPRGPAMPRGTAYRLLAMGSLAEHGGIDTAIKALARIPGTELIIAGEPPPEDLRSDRAIHRLHILAKQTGVDGRVTFLGRIPHDDVPRLLRSADLTLSLPRKAEPGPVPLESMACAVPVVATAVGGQRDSVIDGITGIHVPAHRPAEVAHGIRALLIDPTFRTALGIAGVDRARSRYSWDRIAHETTRVYQQIAREPETVWLAG